MPALRPMSFSLGSKGPSASSHFPDSTLNFPQVKCFSKGQAREEAERKLEEGLRRTWRRTLGPAIGACYRVSQAQFLHRL